MQYFNNDYSEGCHPEVLKRLTLANMEQTPGYGMDGYCTEAADHIRRLCGSSDLHVHFLVGGTQANMTVIAAALRPHQGVTAAVSAHINTHETGAVEATGHKVLGLPSSDGKITAGQVEELVRAHREDASREHTVQPKLVYLSQPTELGTLYSLSELTAISHICREYGLYLFVDGARLGYGLAAQGNDVTLEALAALTDVFYIGGTKVGALFGEAVVISSPALAEDFRYHIKQHGGMLAKGRLLGLQFCALLENGLYFRISEYADRIADEIRSALAEAGYPLLIPGVTNQIFPIFPDDVLEKLEQEYVFCPQERVDARHRAVRICTSWATSPESAAALCRALKNSASIC